MDTGFYSETQKDVGTTVTILNFSKLRDVAVCCSARAARVDKLGAGRRGKSA